MGDPKRLSYKEQLLAAYRRAKKSREPEAAAYYAELLSGLGTPRQTCASVAFEVFKGSAAYDFWKKKPETQLYIDQACTTMLPFG